MEYRRLGRTNLRVSVLGVGCGYLGQVEHDEGVRLLERAIERGINYFDGRYGDSNAKLNPLIRRDRDRFVVVTKTNETVAVESMRRVEEDLVELGSDYIDVFLLRVANRDVLHRQLGPGGAFDGLIKAREQGKIRFMGLSWHGDLTLLSEGIEAGVADVVLFPLNIVRREALEQVIPVAQRHDVGLAVMKPVSVGTIPGRVALPWIMNQPIHTMVPGVTTLAELEEDLAAVERPSMALSAAEKAEVEAWRQRLDRTTCRICDELCGPECEANLFISGTIHHDVWYNHYRNMGLDRFLVYPWAPWAKRSLERHFVSRLEALRRCTWCGKCEARCPYHLPVMDIVRGMLEDHPPLIAALHALGWANMFEESVSPYH